MLMSVQISELRKCTRCRCTLLLKYFETNRKGELFKLCNNCRSIKRDENVRYWDKHVMDIKICERCGSRVRISMGMPRHMKTWSCAKSGMQTEDTREEFYKWILENKDNLLASYRHHIKAAEEYVTNNVSMVG